MFMVLSTALVLELIYYVSHLLANTYYALKILEVLFFAAVVAWYIVVQCKMVENSSLV